MDDRKKRIAEIEAEMLAPTFWSNKEKAQALLKELRDLKENDESAYDKGGAILTVFAGAGGDDAEDFARILVDMYMKFFEKNGFEVRTLHSNENDHGGLCTITIEGSV